MMPRNPLQVILAALLFGIGFALGQRAAAKVPFL